MKISKPTFATCITCGLLLLIVFIASFVPSLDPMDYLGPELVLSLLASLCLINNALAIAAIVACIKTDPKGDQIFLPIISLIIGLIFLVPFGLGVLIDERSLPL